MLQYRNKIISKDKRLLQARELAPLARGYGVPFIVNDDVEIALAVGANGVHLGKDDGDLAAARAKLPGRILGASCYDDLEQAEAAVRAGADYVAFGSVFPSPTKPDAVRAPLSLFRSELGVPLCAIGGITLENAPQLIAAGADLLAVISDLFDAPDIAAARRAIPQALPMKKSRQLFERAQARIPGGVNSPVRAFRAVGGTPVFFERAAGAYLWDADGTRYIDYVGSWGPMLAGHAHPAVVEAVQEAASRALSFGAPTEAEVELAELLCRLVPSLELVRLVSSGTEATMSALRLARGFTGRSLIVKFEGCYHGHADSLLVKAGSGALTFGNPSSAGVPAEIAAHTAGARLQRYLPALKAFFATHGQDIAGVIVEPVAGNMNLVLPAPGFLETLREECTRHGAVLILDEVMTGFRVAPGGAQARYGITPDLTTLGKVIGGGLPLGAFGGRRDIMEKIAPLGPVYQAGTLSGNPVAVAAGLATLKTGFGERVPREGRSHDAPAGRGPGRRRRQRLSRRNRSAACSACTSARKRRPALPK